MARGIRSARPGRAVLWIALLLGVLCGFENHYQALRLVELKIVPAGSLPDPVLWKSIGSLSRRIWVIPVLRRGAITRELEERYPAGINVSVSGWGRISISAVPRLPWIELGYKGQEFVVSTDGYIWPESLSMGWKGVGQRAGKLAKLPHWDWDKDLQAPFEDPGKRENVVQKSTLPIKDVMAWQEKLSAQGWIGKPISVAVSVRGGERFLKVVAQRNKQRIQLEVDDDIEKWDTIFSATRKILSGQPDAGGATLLVDATYEGKIVVGNVPPDGTDGNGRRPEGSESN